MQTTIKSQYSIMGGQVCIEDTRIPVAQIMCELKEGRSISDIMYSYPSLAEETVTVLRSLIMDLNELSD